MFTLGDLVYTETEGNAVSMETCFQLNLADSLNIFFFLTRMSQTTGSHPRERKENLTQIVTETPSTYLGSIVT